MFDRMPADMLAWAKASAATAAEVKQLVDHANGSSTRAKQNKARAELERRYGRRKTARLLEAGLQEAGARPKGWRRLLG